MCFLHGSHRFHAALDPGEAPGRVSTLEPSDGKRDRTAYHALHRDVVCNPSGLPLLCKAWAALMEAALRLNML